MPGALHRVSSPVVMCFKVLLHVAAVQTDLLTDQAPHLSCSSGPIGRTSLLGSGSRAMLYIWEEKKFKIILEIFFENNLFLNYKNIIRTENNFLVSWVSEWWIYVLKLAHIVTIFFYILYLHPIRIRIHNMIINKTEKICLQDFIELLCRFYFIRDIWAKLNK